MWHRLEKKLAGSSNEVVIKVQDERIEWRFIINHNFWMEYECIHLSKDINLVCLFIMLIKSFEIVIDANIGYCLLYVQSQTSNFVCNLIIFQKG